MQVDNFFTILIIKIFFTVSDQPGYSLVSVSFNQEIFFTMTILKNQFLIHRLGMKQRTFFM